MKKAHRKHNDKRQAAACFMCSLEPGKASLRAFRALRHRTFPNKLLLPQHFWLVSTIRVRFLERAFDGAGFENSCTTYVHLNLRLLSISCNYKPQNQLTYNNPLCSISGRPDESSWARCPNFVSTDSNEGNSRARLDRRLRGSSCWEKRNDLGLALIRPAFDGRFTDLEWASHIRNTSQASAALD